MSKHCVGEALPLLFPISCSWFSPSECFTRGGWNPPRLLALPLSPPCPPQAVLTPAETAAVNSCLSACFSEPWWEFSGGPLLLSSAGLLFSGSCSEGKHRDGAFQTPCSSPAKRALPWLCVVASAPRYKYRQSLGHEGRQNVPAKSILSVFIRHVGRSGRVKSGGECGAGLANVSWFFIFHIVLHGYERRWWIKAEQNWKGKQNPNVSPVVLLVVFTDSSSCSTGRQRRVWSPLKRSISLYSLEGKTQRSNVHANHCLSVRSRHGA